MNGIRIRTAVEFVLAALLVAAGVAWFFFAPAGEKAGQEKDKNPSPSRLRQGFGGQVGYSLYERENEAQSFVAETSDTDGDGLLDWEERLRGTDARTPDTDRDGTEDGAEVRAGRDPLKAGMNDNAQENLRTIIAKPEQSIFNYQFPHLQIGGQAISKTEEIPPLADSVLPLEKGETTPPTAPLLGKGGEELHAYGNALGERIQQAAGDGTEESETLNQTIGEVTPEINAKVAALAAKYAALAENINKASVPDEAVAAHQSIAAAYTAYAAALRGLATIGAEGTIPAQAFQGYSDATLALGKAFVEMMQFFAERGVRFAPEEAGEMFNLW